MKFILPNRQAQKNQFRSRVSLDLASQGTAIQIVRRDWQLRSPVVVQ